MDKKNLTIIILSVALAIAVIGFMAVSLKVSKVSREKEEVMQKIQVTERLATQLNKSIADLKMLLGKAEEEKGRLTKEKEKLAEEKQSLSKEAQEMQNRLEAISEKKAKGATSRQ